MKNTGTTSPAFTAERRRNMHELPGTPGNDGFVDSKFNKKVFKLLPGDYFVTRRDEILTTVLGSCIAACIRDPVAGVGGMNHFMLPTASLDSGAWTGNASNANRYGAFAMESLINSVMKFGGRRDRLEVKLFGGAAVIPGMSDVGARNIDFVRRFLHLEGLPVCAESVGDTTPRRVNYFPRTGEVLVRKLRLTSRDQLAAREKDYLSALTKEPVSGDIELFGD
jgi:chemotaxis protein CheD